MPKKKSEHYVNNKEFLEALIVYRAKVENAKENELPKPRITNYLGECFLKIATHLSYKPNFVNYMFREDMISDGIENCVQYIYNFDPAKSSYDEVMTVDDSAMSGSSSDYNTIKDNIVYKTNR